MEGDFIKCVQPFSEETAVAAASAYVENWHKPEFEMNFSVGNKHIFSTFKHPICILDL